MNCSSCGTRVTNNEKHCPNCGRNLGGQVRSRSSAGSSSSGSPGRSLSQSSAKSPSGRDGLRDASSRKSKVVKKKKKTARKSPEVSLEDVDEDELMDSGSDFEAGGAQIRALIHDRPDCLEEGLSIYTDVDAEPVGVEFPTDVGLVDLLARDDAGGLVVVMVGSDSDAAAGKDLVSQALERVGWVRKHVAESKQEVRAIVLLEQVPDDFSYTAAAVSSTVTFKTYRMEINFSDVEV